MNKKSIIIILAIMVLILLGYIFIPKIKEILKEVQPEYSYIFDPDRNPDLDFKDAVIRAEAKKRKILLIVGGDWCKWCAALDDYIESHKEISSYLYSKFVVLKVNWSKDNRNEKFLEKFPNHTATPHFYVLKQDGTLLHSQRTDVLERANSYDDKKFMGFLRKWGEV